MIATLAMSLSMLPVLVAQAALAPVPVQRTPSTGYASVAGLQCDARTVTGANLSFELLQIGDGKGSVLIALGKPNGALIKSGDGIVFINSRPGPREDEYSTGPNLVRIERSGNVRDLTFWSTRDGKAFQPVAYGFCVGAKLAGPTAASTQGEALSLDRASAVEGCHMTTAQPEPWRGQFKASSNTAADRSMVSQFAELPDGVGTVSLNRELLSKAPPAEHPAIDMMVGRFYNAKQGRAPAGMDVMYLDPATRRATILVKFDDLDGKGKQAFGICAFNVTKVEKP